jgi:hypothetical protein
MRALALLALGFALILPAPAADAAMFKCVTRDGTVLFQARPCSQGDKEVAVSGSIGPSEGVAAADPAPRKTPDGDPKAPSMRSPQNAQERAVMERELAQRRDRCRNARDVLERRKAQLDSPNEVARQQAGNEIKIQERRMREDHCDSV